MTDAAWTVAGLVEDYLGWLVDEHPVDASALGDHTHGGALPDLSPEVPDRWTRYLDRLAGRIVDTRERLGLADVPADGKPPSAARDEAADLDVIADTVRRRRFWIGDRDAFRRDPIVALDILTEAVAGPLSSAGPDRTMRARDALARLVAVPRFLEQAASLLEEGPRPHLRLAMQRIPRVRALVAEHAPALVEDRGVGIAGSAEAIELAGESVEAYGLVLRELAEEPEIPWRMGERPLREAVEAAYGQAVDLQRIHDLSAEAAAVHAAELDERCSRVWSGLVGGALPSTRDERIRRVLRSIGERDRADRDMMAAATAAVEEARGFCIEADLVDLPDPSRLRIIETPPYDRGLFPASLRPAPPLAPHEPAVLHVSPVPAEGRGVPARVLREYSRAAVRNLAAHEAYPGHFVQAERARRHRRLARRVFANPLFAEGWATYAEQLVREQGFGDDHDGIVATLMALRVAVATMIDIGLHTGTTGEDEAADLLRRGAFHAPETARAEVARVKVSGSHLTAYFLGVHEMRQLRADVLAVTDIGSLREFHDHVLSHGTVPFPVVRSLLLGRESSRLDRSVRGAPG